MRKSTGSVLIDQCYKYRDQAGRDNRITKLVLEAWEDHKIDIGKLETAKLQAGALAMSGRTPDEQIFSDMIGDKQFVQEMQKSYADEAKKLQEAGAWSSNLPAFAHFTGPVPPPNRALIPEMQFEGPQWKPLVRTTRLENFKLQSRMKMSDLGRYALVPEKGNYNTSPRQSYSTFYYPSKYGLQVGITWEIIVNDDMNAFTSLMRDLVLSGMDSINAYVWGIITANAAIWDGVALFNIAHNNLMALALSIAALTTARAQFKRHLSDSGLKPINNLVPQYLVIPPELEGTALQILRSTTLPTANMPTGTFNPEQNRLTPIVTAYFTDVNDWYLWCSPSIAPVIELGWLFGRDTPEISQKDIWETEEVHYRGRYVVGNGIIGFKGALLSSVTAASS